MSTSPIAALTPMVSGLRPERTELELHDGKDAASELEAYVLRRMMAEMRPAGGWAGGGVGAETFSGMFEEAIADQLAKAGGIGLGEQLRRSMAPPAPMSPASPEDMVSSALARETLVDFLDPPPQATPVAAESSE